MKNRIPDTPPRADSHWAAHFTVGAAVVASAAASTTAVAWQVLQWDLPDTGRYIAAGLGASIAASFALTPLFMSKPWGDSIKSTRWSLLALTFGVMLCDGAFQMNAMNVAAKVGQFEAPSVGVAAILLTVFQLSTFFMRGSLIRATVEQQARLERSHAAQLRAQAKRDRDEARARDRDEKNALKRAQYAEKKNGGLRVVGGRG